jgi:hypothetical protein
MTTDPDGAAAAELARQLLVHAPPGNDPVAYDDWVAAAVTAMADDPAFARLVITSLTVTAGCALWSLDQWSPGVRAAILRLEETQP